MFETKKELIIESLRQNLFAEEGHRMEWLKSDFGKIKDEERSHQTKNLIDDTIFIGQTYNV